MGHAFSGFKKKGEKQAQKTQKQKNLAILGNP